MRSFAAAAWILPALLFFLTVSVAVRNPFAGEAPSQDALPAQEPAAPPVKPSPRPAVSDKAAELAERERALKVEEERLLVLRKEIDEKIAKYEKLLEDMDIGEKKGQEELLRRIDQLAKVFDAMPAEGAASRLEELDEWMAAAILRKMKERKAAGALAAMNQKKSGIIVHMMAGKEKKFPAQ